MNASYLVNTIYFLWISVKTFVTSTESKRLERFKLNLLSFVLKRKIICLHFSSVGIWALQPQKRMKRIIT